MGESIKASADEARIKRAVAPSAPSGAKELKSKVSYRGRYGSYCHCYSWGSVVCHWNRYGCFCHRHNKRSGGCFVYVRHRTHYHWARADGHHGARCYCNHASSGKPVKSYSK
ncbi:hypothetical protein NP493_1385g00001 [Ridgeia piscesae]|uniref:Uncharacterized protein n=1 Tax=Ridgeia piscesae TaxID=27915 RepID=A0AAD9NE42_RIDPI|nr:hypothetical protein NP493_1385g00001 [Ridgeia piscesae]